MPGWFRKISFHSISTRLYAAFAGVTCLTFLAAAIAWAAFGTTQQTLNKLTNESLPLMTGAIQLQEKVAEFATNLAGFGTVSTEAARSTRYLELMKGSSEIDDLMFEVSEQVKGDKAALTSMMDIGATLTTSITALNTAVTKRLGASAKRREAAGQVAAIMADLRKRLDDGAVSRDWGSLAADVGYVGGALSAAALAAPTDDISTFRDSFDSIADRPLRRANAIAPRLVPQITQLTAIGQGETSVFALWETERTALDDGVKAITIAQKGVDELRGLIDAYVKSTHTGVVDQTNIANGAAERGRWLILGVTAAGALISLLIGWLYVARSLIRRLMTLVGAMQTVASGDLTVAVPTGSRDEIGAMADALQVFKNNGLEVERLRKEQTEAARRSQEQRRTAMIELADRCDASVMTIVDHLAGAATEMQATAENLTCLAQEASDQSGAAAHGAESTTVNVQAMAAAVRELSQSIREISQRVNESAEIANAAVEQARKTNETVDGMKRAAQHVGEIVGLINDIASQTNLLALNATIEAARAGEAGKGFAVVASEVKQLANQTSNATEDIRRQIEGMQRITSDAVGAIDIISTTIQRINEISATVASAVVEQGAAIEDMARNAQGAADATGHVSQNIGGVSAASDRTGEAASQVLSASSELAEFAEKLKREVSDFLSTVRAA